MNSSYDNQLLNWLGCPIRKSTDHGLLAAFYSFINKGVCVLPLEESEDGKNQSKDSLDNNGTADRSWGSGGGSPFIGDFVELKGSLVSIGNKRGKGRREDDISSIIESNDGVVLSSNGDNISNSQDVSLEGNIISWASRSIDDNGDGSVG